MQRLALVAGVVATCIATNLLFLHFFLRPGEAYATDARTVKVLCLDCTTTGAQSTQVLGGIGGWATYQVTCSTAGALTWPDTVTLEARDMDDHTWVTVDGHTASTADEREGIYWFAPRSEVRVSIADAAGTRSCTASLAFGRHKEY